MILFARPRSTPCSTDRIRRPPRSVPHASTLGLAIVATQFLIACATAPPVATEVRRIPVQHVFDQPAEYQAYRLSPDGRRLAGLVVQGRAINLVVTELDSGKRHNATRLTDQAISAFFWANNERLVFYIDDARQLLAVNSNGSQPRQLNESGRILQVIHRLPDEPDFILVAEYLPASDSSEVHTLNLMNGRTLTRHLGPPGGWPAEWHTDTDGVIRGATVYSGDQRLLLAHLSEPGGWQLVHTDRRWSPAMRLLDAPLNGPKALAMTISPTGINATREVLIRAFDIETGAFEEEIAAFRGPLCCRVLVQPRTGALLMLAAAQGRTEQVVFLEDRMARWSQDFRAAHPGEAPRFLQTDAFANRALVATRSVLERPDYLLVELESGASRPLEAAADNIAAITTAAGRVRREIAVQESAVRFGLDMPTSRVESGGQREVDRTGIVGSAGGGN